MTPIAQRTDDPRGKGVAVQGRWVPLIGVGSGLLYLALAIAQDALHRAPPTDAEAMLRPFILYAATTIVSFALFITLLVLWARCGPFTRRQRMLAIAFPIVFNVAFMFTPPTLSIDLLSYISHGYIETTLHANPLVEPSSVVADTTLGPELVRYGWRPVHPASPYGPAWTRVEGAVARWFDDVRSQMVALKLVVVAASLGAGLLIWLILGHVRPELRVLGTLAYLWNPMIVMELASDGHNDAVMVFFVLLGLYLTVKRRAVGGIIATSLGVLTKYVPVLFLPLQISWMWRTRLTTSRFAGQVLIGAAMTALLAIGLFAGYWAGSDTWTGVRVAGQPGSTGSTQTIVIELLSRVLSPAVVEPIVPILAVLGLIVYLGYEARSIADGGDLLNGCASLALVYLLFISPSYWPWYAVLPVALLALVPSGSSLLVLLAVSLGSRLAAPLDLLFVHELMSRRVFFALTWTFGLGIPMLAWAIWKLRPRDVFFTTASSPRL
jgi:alpha-1,6-mannosyltransferase